MKKLLSIVLAVVMLATFVVSASAEDVNLLTKGSYGANTDKAIVTTKADGSVKVVVNAGVDAQNNGHGLAVEPQMTSLNVKKDGGTGFIHLVMESTTPFRVTMLDRGPTGDKWISFGGEFFNVFVPEGFTFSDPAAPTIGEALVDGREFMKAGKYDVYLYLGGIYEWKAANGDADKFDPTRANITAIYFEAKNPGTFTINKMDLVASEFEEGGDQGDDTTTTTAPVTGGDSTTTTTSGGDSTTTTVADTTTTTTPTTTTTAPQLVTANGKLEALDITMTADKAAYAAGEPIKVTLTVKNTSDKAVDNVNLESVIPQGYKLQDGAQNKANSASLGAGQTITLNAVFVEGTSDNGGNNGNAATTTVNKGDVPKEDSPKTADVSATLMALAVAIGAVALTLVSVKTGKGKQMLSLALCLTLGLSMASIVPTMTDAAESYGSTTVTVNVTAKGAPLALLGVVSFGNAPTTTTTKAPEQTQVTSPDNSVSFTLETPTMPQSLSHVSDADKTYARYSVNAMSYELDSSGNLILKFDVEKTYDREGAGFGRPCAIGYDIYDSEGYVVAGGVHWTNSMRKGDKVRASTENTYFKPESGKSYRLELVGVKGEQPSIIF